MFSACAPEAPVACFFDGKSLESGTNVDAYQTSSVPYGDVCTKELRSCQNGVLTGSFTFSNCTVNGPVSCLFNGKTIARGESVEAFLQSSVPSDQKCTKELRLCENGVLSGSFSNSTCTAADSTGPQIQELKAEPEYPAGGSGKIYVKATDENSGLNVVGSGFCWNITTSDGQQGVPGISQCGNLMKEESKGPDWYSFSIFITNYTPAGEYLLYAVYLRDNANNIGGVTFGSSGNYANYPAQSPTQIPLLKIKVKNTQPEDSTGPQVQELQAEAEYPAGGTGKIYVKATDEGSGLSVGGSGFCWNITTSDGQTRASGISQCGNLVKEEAKGPDWYSFSISMTNYTPEGEYLLAAVYLRDNANNVGGVFSSSSGTYLNYTNQSPTQIPILKIKVKNSLPSDSVGPQILELHVEPAYLIGESGKIYVKAKDEGSGLSVGGSGFCWKITTPDGEQQASGISQCGNLVQEDAKGPDWYSFSISVSTYTPEGDYPLAAVYLRDNANNVGGVFSSSSGTYINYTNQSPTQIPISKIKVIR